MQLEGYALRSDAVKEGPERAPHRSLLKAIGLTEQEIRRPFVAIANSWNEIVPGHVHLQDISDEVRKGIRSAKGTPFEFNTIGICDGIAMGHEGMKYSLPSRELIADSIELMVNAHCFDAMVLISSCDKILPGHLMAAARLDLPSIVVTGGPMFPGSFRGKKVDLIDVFEGVGGLRSGRITAHDLLELENNACPGPGSCAGMFTANTMACLTEALGMSMPGCATAHATTRVKRKIAYESGRTAMKLLEEGVRPSCIMTKEAFENAIRVDMALGGSTNTILHLPAIAREIGIDLPIELFDEVGRNTPQLCSLRPGGVNYMKDLDRAGGVPAVLKRLEPMLNLDVDTVSGKTLRELISKYAVKDEKVVRPLEDPVDRQGGVAVLRGNLAPNGAVMKIASVPGNMIHFEGKAKVFDSEEKAIESIREGAIDAGSVIVIRYEGPKGGPGMREMLEPTATIMGMNLEDKVVLVTDGRFSGGTRGPCIGHVSPEAAEGGPIGLVQDGDMIEMDLERRELNVKVDDRELQRRRGAWHPPLPRVSRGYLGRYSRLVQASDRGVVL